VIDFPRPVASGNQIQVGHRGGHSIAISFHQFVSDRKHSRIRFFHRLPLGRLSARRAAKYRQFAEMAEDLAIKQELLELAEVCEEGANNMEDRIPGG
jgi:hypothetical protein